MLLPPANQHTRTVDNVNDSEYQEWYENEYQKWEDRYLGDARESLKNREYVTLLETAE